MTTQPQTFNEGDLVEVTNAIPWDDSKPVGTLLLIDSAPREYQWVKDEFPDIEGPFYDVADPQGMWFGGDSVPASHIKLVKESADVIPTAKAIAQGLHAGLMCMDRDVLRIEEVGEESEDGATLYAYGSTPDGVRVSFLLRVGAVMRADG